MKILIEHPSVGLASLALLSEAREAVSKLVDSSTHIITGIDKLRANIEDTMSNQMD